LQIEGASVIGALQQASLYLHHGLASAVACVFSAVPLRPGRETGTAAYRGAMHLTGIEHWEERYGLLGAAGAYALAAQRYLQQFGLAADQFGAYAVACRQWAAGNPQAMLRQPLDMAGYLASRRIVDPFRVLDCAYAVNGAIAVILTRPDRARDTAKPPVHVHAFAQGHAGARNFAGEDVEISAGGAVVARSLWKQAGVGPGDVQMAQLYDAFSWLAVQALEDYGLCDRGDALRVIAEGHTAPGGRLPVNTGGGHLSGFYLQGMTPVAEAVIQARGEGGERQSPHNELILVTGNGGRSEYHAALLLSPLDAL
jgi:acetyl-CoA acetyltransferase